MKLKIRDRIKLFRHGLKIAQSKNWFIVWNKKTGIPVNYYLPFIKRHYAEDINEAEKTFIANLKVSDYRRPFMKEEEVKAFNEETKQHLKDRLKVIDEKIKLNKDKPVNFPTTTENSDEKRIRESGVMYLECPVCNHVFFNYEKTRHTIKCYCKCCDKEYYGFDKGDEVIFSEEGSIFTPYKTAKWKRGK